MLEKLVMLRLFMLMLVMLCVQFSLERKAVHKVSNKVSSYPSTFRIDENFNRSYASISMNGPHSIKINNEKWKIKKYIKPDINRRESLSINTVVNSEMNNQVSVGQDNKIKLKLVVFQKDRLLVLENPYSNEFIELIPYRAPIVTQVISSKASSIKKIDVEDPPKRVNGIETGSVDLVFVEARIPKLSKKPLYNNAISGRINLNNGEIDNGELVFNDLLKIGPSQIEPIELNYITIKNGGQISFEYMGQMVSGIFSKAGNGLYVMRVATGLLSGASFKFGKENSEAVRKRESILTAANEEQERLVKERSLASKRALEGSGYNF